MFKKLKKLYLGGWRRFLLNRTKDRRTIKREFYKERLNTLPSKYKPEVWQKENSPYKNERVKIL